MVWYIHNYFYMQFDITILYTQKKTYEWGNLHMASPIQ